MIFGTIQKLHQDKKYLSAVLLKGLEFLKVTNFSQIEEGQREIKGKDIYALIQKYNTQSREARVPEAHEKFIDIHYVAEGTEMIGFAIDCNKNQISDDFLQEKDALLYKQVENEFDLVLHEGMYAIFFPREIHRPGCSYREKKDVKKVVVKVSTNILS